MGRASLGLRPGGGSTPSPSPCRVDVAGGLWAQASQSKRRRQGCGTRPQTGGARSAYELGPGPLLTERAQRPDYQLVSQHPGPLRRARLCVVSECRGHPSSTAGALPNRGVLSPRQATKPREEAAMVGTPTPEDCPSCPTVLRAL